MSNKTEHDEHDEHDENFLIARAKAGDHEAFGDIMGRYNRPILDFVYRMVGDPWLAEDLAQDVFVRAWRGLDRFEHRVGGSLSTWLFQIARNLCIDFYRRQPRDPLTEPNNDPHLLERSSTADSANAEVNAREAGQLIAAAVAGLPEKQRTAVVLSEYEGLSYKQIAKVMRCSEKSVETRLYRARQTLRFELRDLKSGDIYGNQGT